MKTFKASTLAGHLAFKPEIQIDDYGVTFKIPGLFSNQKKTVDFDNISSVSYSDGLLVKDIFISIKGADNIKAEGFSASDAKEIKKIIEDRKRNPVISSSENNESRKSRKKTRKHNSDDENNDNENETIEETKESPMDNFIRRQNNIELEYLKKEKEIELEKQKIELKEKKLEFIRNDKKRLIERYKAWAYFIIFWKYILDKIWKKIVFIIILLIIANSIYSYFHDLSSKDIDKQKLEKIYINLQNEKVKVDSILQFGIKDEEMKSVREYDDLYYKLSTSNRFLKDDVENMK